MPGFLEKLFGPPIQSITAQEAHERLGRKGGQSPILLDVRNKDEFQLIHAPNARLVPLHELSRRMNDLPKNREILVICASGSRSRPATKALVQAGYTALNVSGGMNAWVRSGLPIKR